MAQNTVHMFNNETIAKLAEIGKQTVHMRLQNQRRAQANRAILRAVDRYLHDSPVSLQEACIEANNSAYAPIDDAEIADLAKRMR